MWRMYDFQGTAGVGHCCVATRNEPYPIPNSFPKCLASQMALAQVVACALNSSYSTLFSIRLIQLFSTRATPRVTSPKNISLQKSCFLYGTSH